MSGARNPHYEELLNQVPDYANPPPEVKPLAEVTSQQLIIIAVAFFALLLFFRFMAREALLSKRELFVTTCPSCGEPMRRRRSNKKSILLSLIVPCIRVYCSSCHKSYTRLLRPKGKLKKRRKHKQ